MMDSASTFFKFKLDYSQTKHLGIGKAVHSDAISAGGHMWRINCYPRGTTVACRGEHLSIFVELLSKSRSVKAIFEVFMLDKGGQPSLIGAKGSGVHVFQVDHDNFGWITFVRQIDMLKDYVTDGQITFICSIVVLEDSSIPMPPSDIGKNLGTLLDNADGADVIFTVGDDTFHVHRAVLSARSPVFRVELLGSITEARMPCITLNDIAPGTFKAMLRFMYTDALPGDEELGTSPAVS
uniref:BTB domain-containing protein n=1 Tax=Arundo donax TaxID=35708 RepID=A0A0A9CM01_ARUDO